MNTPPYILTDVFASITSAVKSALNLPALNYQYGYVTELNETLKEYNGTAEFRAQKFPLIWLQQPFTIERGETDLYGKAEVKVFIFNSTEPKIKASQRMEDNFKPIIQPIYRELMNQIHQSEAFSTNGVDGIEHNYTERYWWGEPSELNDVVDCLEISRLKLLITHNFLNQN